MVDFAKQLLGATYYDLRTLSFGSLGPLVNSGLLHKVSQRVGGRAGTAAPQGAVCELPNPLFFPGGLCLRHCQHATLS